MWDWRRGKSEPERKPVAAVDREWLDLELRTTKAVSLLFENRDGLLLLAAATFALQQDFKRAVGLDLRKTHDGRQTPELVGSAMQSLGGLMNLNQDVCDNPPKHPDSQFIALTSKMRALAAAIWLLTIRSRNTDSTHSKLSVVNIWMKLGMVDARELAQNASQIFTGTYLNDVACEQFDFEDWPLRVSV